MGHHITALVARQPYDKEAAGYFDLKCFEVADAIGQGYVIVGLNAYHSDFWYEKLGWEFDMNDSKIICNNRLTHFFAHKLGFQSYALVNTDYVGGTGFQTAAFYERGNVVISELEQPGVINAVLRHLGVRADGYVDEFAAIDLPHYREFDDYYEKYYDDEI